MKVLIAADGDRILGFTAFGTEVSEQMAAVQTAMLGDLPYTTLRDATVEVLTLKRGPPGMSGPADIATSA